MSQQILKQCFVFFLNSKATTTGQCTCLTLKKTLALESHCNHVHMFSLVVCRTSVTRLKDSKLSAEERLGAHNGLLTFSIVI